ncbi:hypothetical protein GN109_06000 [Collimonas pratensis]|uniref:baseplate hub protein n=1 Tax=Collimonas pratensis TaxID=279113 RepID=UPI00143D02EB|nr:hypothetical protein [Collimonas pratensis]NKI68966.1 hypothetical protein [Collimonas pratensis]
MSASFTKKRLDLTITLGEGAFGDTVGDTVTLSGLRMTASAVSPGGETMGALQLRVFGLPQTMMNQLTTIGQVNRAIRTKNSILLAAGDDESGMQTVFQGTIFDAWADYGSAPEVAFNIIGYAGLDAAVKPVNALSFKGSADVAQIMSGLADTMGLTFENNGVSAQLSNPYFPGTALTQVKSCARAANILFVIDRGTLAIWPRGASRAGEIPMISPETGMVGYPAPSSKGMTVHMIFNWNIRQGGDVLVQSSIPMATGKFHVFNVSHELSSEMPGGPWFTTMECFNASAT